MRNRSKRYNEREMCFELYDIMEEASIYGTELDDRIEENIKYVLKREGLLPEGASIVIPMGALHWECSKGEGTCWYYANFEVFDKTGNRILARGTANGTLAMLDEETVELIDMHVWMPTKFVKELKTLVELLKE